MDTYSLVARLNTTTKKKKLFRDQVLAIKWNCY